MNNVYGYSAGANPVVEVLKASGDNLTRENIMKQAARNSRPETADAAAGHQRIDQRQLISLRSNRCNCKSSRVKPGSCSAR